MKTRTISLNHPAITVAKILGRRAVSSSGRVGVLEKDPLNGALPVIGFPDKTWVPTGSLIKLVMED